MARYIVERTIPKLSQAELQSIGKNAAKVADQLPGVVWIKSSISESEGKSYCEFDAPNPDVLREHAQKAGLPVDRITAIEREIDPSMFR
jgi:Nickel responsive protein SCO4226-like